MSSLNPAVLPPPPPSSYEIVDQATTGSQSSSARPAPSRRWRRSPVSMPVLVLTAFIVALAILLLFYRIAI